MTEIGLFIMLGAIWFALMAILNTLQSIQHTLRVRRWP
jgi:hypothetical protein